MLTSHNTPRWTVFSVINGMIESTDLHYLEQRVAEEVAEDQTSYTGDKHIALQTVIFLVMRCDDLWRMFHSFSSIVRSYFGRDMVGAG
jgi:hypothetical protein